MKALQKFVLILVVVGAVAGGGWYFFNQGKQGFVIRPGEKLSDEQVSELIDRVGRFLVLPNDEQPSVAAISDAVALSERQSFYKDAKDGDILIVYSSKAIIYDAEADKLVNVGPIVRTDLEPRTASRSEPVIESPEEPAAEPVEVTVEVRNGTSTAGLAGAMASALKKNEFYSVEKVGDATGSYDETLIVDLSDGDADKGATIAELAGELNAEVVTELPDGERASKYDVLILIGK